MPDNTKTLKDIESMTFEEFCDYTMKDASELIFYPYEEDLLKAVCKHIPKNLIMLKSPNRNKQSAIMKNLSLYRLQKED